MSYLVVMAHFDVDRRLRPHTLRTLQNFAHAADRVVVVSTSGIDDESLELLPDTVEPVARENFGYDFFSYKWGLDVATDYADFDRILICNDSFIGPTVDLGVILGSEAASACDVMGMTLSHKHGLHAQSFFMVVNRFVARSQAFRRFWKDMVPISDRFQVIKRYEVGFSTAMTAAGFKLGSYFQPTEAEQSLAAERFRWHTTHRLDSTDQSRTISELHEFNLAERPWNPAAAYADRIALDDRLPLLKVDTLRFDPYALGADRLLAQQAIEHPETFADVAEFLDLTQSRYPIRPGEQNLPVSETELREAGVGYLLDPAFVATERSLTR